MALDPDELKTRLQLQKIEEFKARIEANLKKAKDAITKQNAHPTQTQDNGYQIQQVDPNDQGVMDSCFSQELFANVFENVLTENVLKQIETLQPGESINVKRPPNSDKIRTFNICMDENGEIYLFIEPKSKRWDNTRRAIGRDDDSVEWVGGSYKKRKLAVRADAPTAEVYVAMVEYVEQTADFAHNQENLELIDQERERTQLFCGETGFPSKCIFGGSKVKVKDGATFECFTTYAPYKPSNLRDFLTGRWSPAGVVFNEAESKALRLDIMRQIFEIVHKIHDEYIVHKDLKPDNFLIKYNYDTARFEVEVIDFGLSCKIGEHDLENGTSTHMPPWLVKRDAVGFLPNELSGAEPPQPNYSDDKKEYLERFKDKYVATLGWEVLDQLLTLNMTNTEIKSSPIRSTKGEHDIWSLGIMFYQIVHEGLDSNVNGMWEEINKSGVMNYIFGNYFKAVMNAKAANGDLNIVNDAANFIPGINDVRNFFANDLSVQKGLASLPKPEDHKYDPSISTTRTDSLEDFRKLFARFSVDYDRKIDSFKSSGKKTATLQEMLEICPIYVTAKKYSKTKFTKLHDDPIDKAGYDVILKFAANMSNRVNTENLKKQAQELQTLLDKVNISYNSQDRLSKEQWIKYARWQLFLHSALCLTYMRINEMNLKDSQIVKKSNIPWFLSPNKFYQRLIGFKPNASSRQDTLDYPQEITANKKQIAGLIEGLKSELLERDFEKEFTRRKI